MFGNGNAQIHFGCSRRAESLAAKFEVHVHHFHCVKPNLSIKKAAPCGSRFSNRLGFSSLVEQETYTQGTLEYISNGGVADVVRPSVVEVV